MTLRPPLGLSLSKRTLAALLTVAAALLVSRFAPSLSARSTRSMATATNSTALRNVVVVGGSYVGQMAGKELLATLNPETHRLVIVDRNSHFGHLFAYPRFAIAPAYEHKAFIPFHPMLPAPHAIVQASALSLVPPSSSTGGGKVVLDRAVQLPGQDTPAAEIEYDALVLATGTKLSKPGTLETEKKDSVMYLQGVQQKLKAAKDIVIIGGGAVGVQMATDLAILYPGAKSITVVQSRRLMPRFHPKLHEIVQKRFDELGVKTVLNVRADIPEGGYEALNESGEGGEVVLKDGRRIKADYVIHALGQTPSSDILSSAASSAILPNRFVRVAPSLLVDPIEDGETKALDERVFAVGDIADSGAPKAARPAMQQAVIVAKNIASRLTGASSSSFETYTPGPGAIHLTLGIVESIIFRNPTSHPDPQTGEAVWEAEPEFFWKDDGVEDMNINSVWERRVPGFVNGDEQRYHL